MGSVLDLFRVLFSPGEVFERVRERPKFLMPWIGLSVVIVVLSYLVLPYAKAAIAPQIAQAVQQNPNAAARIDTFLMVNVALSPIIFLVLLFLGAGILWLLVMLLAGADAKFMTLVSVTVYSAVPTILLQVAGLIVLRMKGVEAVTSQADLRPALGLNLLAPDAVGFVGAFLAGVNPFSLWGMVLTAIGIHVTHKTSKGSAYTVAIVSLLIGILIQAGLAGLGNRGR